MGLAMTPADLDAIERNMAKIEAEYRALGDKP